MAKEPTPNKEELDIWERALTTIGVNGILLNSDRGSVYTGRAFCDLCLTKRIIPSVGHTGICYDNAATESWNAIYKKELTNLHI